MGPQPLRHHIMFESEADSRARGVARTQSARSLDVAPEDWQPRASVSKGLDDADDISTFRLCCLLLSKFKGCFQLVLMTLCVGTLLIFWAGDSVVSLTRQISNSRALDVVQAWTVPQPAVVHPASARAVQGVAPQPVAAPQPAAAAQPVQVAQSVAAAIVEPLPPPAAGDPKRYVAWSVDAKQNLITDAATAEFLPADAPEIVEAARVRLPDGFDWEAYLFWNADLRKAGLTTREQAEAHFLENGHTENRMHKPAKITLRYTACGGLFNQHYCHLSAIALAIVLGAREVIWPPMQERTSFSKKYNSNSRQNMQTWRYVDAQSLWDLPTISKNLQGSFNLTVTKHPAHCPMPDFSSPTTAYQLCSLSPGIDMIVQVPGDMYLQHLTPDELRSLVIQSIQEVWLRGAGLNPTNILVDLPCTLFMMEFRKTEMVEDIARSFVWAPAMQLLADQVIAGIKNDTAGQPFNGIHLRMEKDAADWALMTGGMKIYWREYKDEMVKARFNVDPRTLYVASGLLKSATSVDRDKDAEAQMTKLSKEIVDLKYASRIVYKEMYLNEDQLRPVLNEQSALIDYLVLRESMSLVGVGMSTFSFYLQEERLMAGLDPRNTSMLMLPAIGTDELFFSAAVVAIRTRKALEAQNRLHDVCRRINMEPCFSET